MCIRDRLWLTTYKPNNVISVSGGMRYDYGYIPISSHEDDYLADYLRKQGYDEELSLIHIFSRA